MSIRRTTQRAASSLYAATARTLRPGGFRARLHREAHAREPLQWQSPEAVWQRQRKRLEDLLRHAAETVPYYRRLAREGRLPHDVREPADLAAIPVLTKAIIRHEGEALLAEGFPRERMRRNATGGSTGEPLHFWSDDDAVFAGNVSETWAAGLAGLQGQDAVARLWGAGGFSEPSALAVMSERFRSALQNELFIDCFRMSPADLADAHRRLQRFRPDGLVGYSSALVELAAFLSRQGIQPDYPRKAILSAAEALDDVARQSLQRVFGVPVYDRYGSREIGCIAMECDRHEGLHVDCENIFVELIDDPDGSGLGRIIVTRLNQRSMPFIRYDIGDLAEGPLAVCSCGRGYPVLRRIVGRVTEAIRFPDGAVLPGEIFPHLFKDCGIALYRVTQAEDYSVDVALVRVPEQTDEQNALLRRVVCERFADRVPVAFRYVEAIERSPTGKLLPVVSRAPKPSTAAAPEGGR